MKVISARHIKTEGLNPLDRRFFVDVEVEKGLLFKRRKTIHCGRKYGSLWIDLDDGCFVPFEIELAIRALALRQGIEL